ncbi:2-dehydro-3-deoxygluconokinase [Halobacillus karajensis]|uniref:2-dehydro-3-deoxygluconokinase n=1 Tax=Halobacillus karajensis TaxID=195088 RepID=A0A024P835_9BACI|nr:sugar kinase [Halobacillus karajensis]CDQ20232.1 2-dehydro-3-deoxygluconokinase [Halobacillus karajensis]CDQ25105.1 2-dehydro-3-deoxygluconokinase [Halobacillus karajensis]CDQ28534.1 2-dehydro-3-deoxygluconokinase [Halobacillus karajensis]SEI02218.1 2-dehydro-3-deoxygluconokinase [Halobacillus karajensis]
MDVITMGDAMVAFNPTTHGPMRFVSTFEKKVGGAELNTAIGCARLGLQSGWISALGKDEFGRFIHHFARGEGVDVSEVTFTKNYPTSLNFKEFRGDGRINTTYYRHPSPFLALSTEDVNENYIKRSKILHLTGLLPGVDAEHNIPIIKQAIALAKKHHVKVSFDPNIRLKLWTEEKARTHLAELLPDVDILLAGKEEMEIILGTEDTDEIIEQAKELGISYVALKKGAAGSVGYHEGETIESPPIPPSQVVDTVGAGDGFNAGILYGLIHDWPLKKTLHFANLIGSKVVSVNGDNEGLPFLEDLLMDIEGKDRIDR